MPDDRPNLFKYKEFLSKIGSCGRCIRIAGNAAVLSWIFTALLLVSGPVIGSFNLESSAAITIASLLSAWYLVNLLVFAGRIGVSNVGNYLIVHENQPTMVTRRGAMGVFLKTGATALVLGVGMTVNPDASQASCCYCAQTDRNGRCICWRRSSGCNATCVCR